MNDTTLTDNSLETPDAVAPTTPRATGSAIAPEELERLTQDIIGALKSVYDPEIPSDIYELGLIYDVHVGENAKIDLVMTLTSPHCPVAEILPEQVKSRVELVDGVNEVELELTWDPPWDPEMMSEAAKLECGFM